jgi:hypothetical protein
VNTQIFDFDVLDSPKFTEQTVHDVEWVSGDRLLRFSVKKSAGGRLGLTCRQDGFSNIVLECSRGDVNLVAHCIATGEDRWTPFSQQDVLSVKSWPHIDPIPFEAKKTGRTLWLEYDKGLEMHSLKVKGRGVSGGSFKVYIDGTAVRIVGSRLLTGRFM